MRGVRLHAFLLAFTASTALAQQDAPPPRDPASERPATRDELRREERPARKALDVEWHAPEPLKGLFQKYIPPPKAEGGVRRAGSLRPWIRDVRRKVPEIAAAEGYFSTTVEVEMAEDREAATVTVNPGVRTTVKAVEIEFAGDLAGPGAEREKRRRKRRELWPLKAGRPFRSSDWEGAKTQLHESLVQVDYAAGVIAKSEAIVDAEAASAALKLVLDSGPPFTLGEVRIEGVQRYPEAVVRRMVFLEPGERYDADRLIELQRMVQNGPWFATVIVDVERDAMRPQLVPVKISVTERPAREIGVALGYGTDDGLRAEAGFRHRDLLDRGLDLQSSIRAAQKRQIGYVDVYLPPGLMQKPGGAVVPFKDSVGVLAEHSTIENLALSRFAVAGYRHFNLEAVETRVGLTYQIERKFPAESEPRITRALAPVASITWRHVDNVFDPHKGGVLNLQVAAAKQSIASERDFLKLYGQYQYWFPITPRDQIVIRGEIGSTLAESRVGIPEDFLFRAGGSRSNRGYAFQSLGVREGNAVVGGRYIATGTLEYVHWLNDRWGAAVFTDAGDAADTRGEWNGNPSYGVGARFRTPAGPFALDLAYAERTRRFRLSFSISVAL